MKNRSSFLSCFGCFFPTTRDLDTKTKGGKDKCGSSTSTGFYVHHNTLYENGALPKHKAGEGAYLMISKNQSKLLPGIAEDEASEDLLASKKPHPHAEQAIASVLQPVNSATSSSAHGEDEADVQALYQEMTNLNDENHVQQITVVEELDERQDSDHASLNTNEKQAQTTLPGEAVEEDIVQSSDAVVSGERGIGSHPVKLDRIISIQSNDTTIHNEEEDLSPSDVE